MLEVLVGVMMATVLLTVLGQMLVAMRQSSRRAEERALMLRAVENALEEFTAAPWAAIDDPSAAKLQLSSEVRGRWPEAALSCRVTASSDPVEAKQVTLSLSLAPDSPQRPVSLTTWVFKALEE